jgi:GNAT superfamily N-acetyltransferase
MNASELPRRIPLNDLLIRRLEPTDSVDELTALLHRAFAPLGRMGLTCSCIAQSAATTALRVARGTCFVALRGRRIVGTVTVERPDPAHACAWYRRPQTASAHQFAVEPGVQHHGCGTRLLEAAQDWAATQACTELALDTPQRARHLVDWYRGHGFAPVAHYQHAGQAYRSVVLGKCIAEIAPPPSAWQAPHRTWVEPALR